MLANPSAPPRATREGDLPEGAFTVAAVAILAVGAALPFPIILVSAVSEVLALTWLRLLTLFLAQGERLAGCR